MACNFNIENYVSHCADISGVASVSLIAKDKVSSFDVENGTYTSGKISAINYVSSDRNWGKMEVKQGKGTIQLASTIDTKKGICINTYTLTFHLDAFNANILKENKYITSEVLAMVKLNNGKMYVLGKSLNTEDYDDCRISNITSTTGAAFGDAAETVYTITWKTTGVIPELSDGAKMDYNITSNSNQAFDYVK